jgi:hypothetical protein
MDTRFDRISRGLATTSSRRQALKMLGGGLVGGALAGAGFAVAKDTAAQGGLQLFDDAGALLGTVTGLVATNNGSGIDIGGVFSDTATPANVTPFTAPLIPTASSGSCEILDLVLGPLDLNLLGLVVTLDTVHLNITAERGPGNLLGNLLCAVAGLLNPGQGGGLLNRLTDLLNQIFGTLGLAA